MTDASIFNANATANEALPRDPAEPISIEQIGASEIHSLIQQAQFAMWDTEGEAIELPYFRVGLSGADILHEFYRLLPDTEEATHYRYCQSCARAIVEQGNWVVVNYDGTLDSVMFPAIDVPAEFENEWTKLLDSLNKYITRQLVDVDSADADDVATRPIRSLVCRPLDGAMYPKSHRSDERTHFGVFTTPRQLVSARTLCKANDRLFARAKALTSSAGFNSANLAGLLALNEAEFPMTEAMYLAVNAASVVFWSIDTYAFDKEAANNIITAACYYDEGLGCFPLELLPALDAFENTGDYDQLVKDVQAISAQTA